MVQPSQEMVKHRDIAFAGALMSFNVPLKMHLYPPCINAYLRAFPCPQPLRTCSTKLSCTVGLEVGISCWL